MGDDKVTVVLASENGMVFSALVDRYLVVTKADLQPILDRLTALERRGETKDYDGSAGCCQPNPTIFECDSCGSQFNTFDGLCVHRQLQHKPTPATVERFTVFQYRDTGVVIPGHTGRGSTKVEFGEVVATRYIKDDLWYVQLHPKKDAVVMAQDTYTALVNMMLQCGCWERQK